MTSHELTRRCLGLQSTDYLSEVHIPLFLEGGHCYGYSGGPDRHMDCLEKVRIQVSELLEELPRRAAEASSCASFGGLRMLL